VLIKLMRDYLRAYRPWLLLVLVFQTIQAVATLSLPTLNANIIDNGALKGDTSYIWKVGAIMLAVTLVQVCFAVAATYFGARSAMGFGRDVRHDLFHTVMGYSAREVGQFGAPSLITRLTNDVTQVQVFTLMTLTLFVTAPIMIIGGVIFAVREDGALSLILLVAVPILLLSVGQVAIRMHPQFTKMQNRIDRVNQVLREQISGMRVVRAFVREPDEAVRFGKGNADLTETSLKTGRMMAVMFPAVLLTINISSVAAVYFGADRINAGQMQVGSLVAFLSYLIQILMAVMMSTFVLMMGPRASVCAGRIQEVLRTSSSVVNPTDGVSELPGAVSLELRHAEFAFPGAEQPVLHDLNFRVEAGQTLAIIGSTGSGKTALLNLIARLFDATNGQVLISGIDVRELDQRLVERLIGFVPQKPFLFSGTVATNVRFGNQDATDAEVWEALEVAQARDFVEAKPDQLDAPIAQGGTNVSGGQRQRLAIARALAHKPAIYLFDDSFSALDLATDARLRAALAPVTTEAVTVVVAQRVSTIVRADQILVLEEGRIVGLGTHRELLESCRTYQEIVESQFVAEEEVA
jgi:ATP-binding cassette, subfamily B, multidrug efflux pump